MTRKGTKLPPAQYEALVARLKSPEHRAIVSAANHGRVQSVEERAKRGAARRGKKHSDETRAKISAAAQARMADPATRQKAVAQLADWRAGHSPRTPENQRLYDKLRRHGLSRAEALREIGE